MQLAWRLRIFVVLGLTEGEEGIVYILALLKVRKVLCI